jgi:hypothetical protein
VWYMSVITVPLQALVSYLFVRHEFRRRLDIALHTLTD